MKKLLSIAAITGLLVTGAMASSTTKFGIYGGYGAGSFSVDNDNYSANMHLWEGGLFIDHVKGHLYTGLEVGYGKYDYGLKAFDMAILRGKAGVHFDTFRPINIYAIATGGYGGNDNSDFATFGYGAGFGIDLTKHWGIELNYIHSVDNHIYVDYPEPDGTYPDFKYSTDRGEAFIKYSF